MLNKKTPKIDPWGQPPETGLGSDHVQPTLMVITRFDKKVAMRRMIWDEAPLDAKALRQCWNESLLKAFE